MTSDGGRIYDSFVVRIWRETASGDIQRVEVEHVQTAQIDHAAGVAAAWVLERILGCLEETLPAPGGAPAGD